MHLELGTICIGLFLLGFYSARFVWFLRHRERYEGTYQDRRLEALGGWFFGCALISGASIFILPSDLLWICIPAAVVLVLLWFPVSAMLRIVCGSEDTHPQGQSAAEDGSHADDVE